ncbi:hypothetical protein LXL04_031982 [Taraxacum kok-saghyz]
MDTDDVITGLPENKTRHNHIHLDTVSAGVDRKAFSVLLHKRGNSARVHILDDSPGSYSGSVKSETDQGFDDEINLDVGDSLVKTDGEADVEDPELGVLAEGLDKRSLRIRQLSDELKRLTTFSKRQTTGRLDRTKTVAAYALKGLKFISKKEEGTTEIALEMRFEDLTKDTNGLLPRSLLWKCIGMNKESKEFAEELFVAVVQRRGWNIGDSINKVQMKEFWDEISDQSFDSRLRIFLDMVDKDADGRITEDEVRKIILISASANKLSNIDQYTTVIMEELDPHGIGYIMIEKFEELLLQAQTQNAKRENEKLRQKQLTMQRGLIRKLYKDFSKYREKQEREKGSYFSVLKHTCSVSAFPGDPTVRLPSFSDSFLMTSRPSFCPVGSFIPALEAREIQMEDLLYVKDYYMPVFNTDKPENKTDAEWNILHRQVCGYIRQWVDDNVLNHISGETHARTLWNKLEELYARKTGNNKLFLIKQMMSLKYHDGTPILDHLNTFQGIINQLAGMGIKFEDEIQGLWLLGSLPDSWETFRTSLSNSAANGIITMELAKGSILNEEMRRKSQGSSSQSDVLVTDGRGRSQSRGPSNKGKHRSKSKGKFTEYVCNHCGKKGHTIKYCRQLKKENKKANYNNQKNNRKNDDGDNDTAETNTVTEEFFICVDSDMVNLAHDDTSWVVDNGATCHVTSQRDFYTSYTPGDFGIVKMGNNGFSKIAGVGDICMKFDTGMELVLHNVKHVPDMRLNLISAGLLDDDGYDNTFGGGKWELARGSLIVARGVRSSKLYMTHPKISKDSVNASMHSDMTELWHKRLGHMSEKGMSLLLKKNVLTGVHGVTLKRCSHCLDGKQTRVSFKSSTPSRKESILDLIHSDVCGPMKTRTIGGCLYFVTFIDDHSRKVWVYTLKTKDQVLEKFKQFHALVERQTGKKLKCIRTDNGGEYIGPFDAYCREHGIRHQKSPPKTPQLNGLAERMNRTLNERVTCLLSHANLPKSFWGEALNTAVHVINLTPCVPLSFDVPDKVWSGKNVSYRHLRVFGCKAFVHIPKDERSKLDVKSKPCIFLGYGQDEFGYRLYDPVLKKIVRSRDVVFVEDQTLKDIEKSKIVPKSSDDLVDLDPVPPQHFEPQNEDDVPNDVQEEQELDEDFHPELPVPDMPPFVPLRRSSRDRHPSTRYSADEYVLLTDGGEPECYEEAMEDEHKKKWVEAMQDEMTSLHENNTFELVKLPKGKRALKNKWVYKVKTEEHTARPRYKARLVVKGFSQRRGIDFDEIFSPVVKMGSIRVVLGLAASLDLEVEQMDVKTAFLHGDLDKEIYMEQPKGFRVKGKEDYVCRLQKSLYGLKQAPRQWYKKFESVMGKQGYRKTASDHCVFFQRFGDDDFIILLLYVDDMLIVGKNAKRITQLKKELSKSFAMKDLGPAKQILGVRITRDRASRKLHISQEQYIEKVLRRFNMDKAKVVSSPLTTNFKLTDRDCPSIKKEIEEMDRVPYASAVGSLMYAMVCTRPDIAHAVGVVSRFLSNPGKKHWEAVRWIFRYLRGTSKLGITFGNGPPNLVGFTDSDMAGNKDNMKSTSGYLMTFAGGAVSWQSRLQKCVALSTTEAEYMAATEACKELLWMKRFLQELGFMQKRYVVLCDNESAIHLAKNSMYHKRTKHIDVRYHWIRDCLEDKMFELEKVHTNDNGSDMLTKALASENVSAFPGDPTVRLPSFSDSFLMTSRPSFCPVGSFIPALEAREIQIILWLGVLTGLFVWKYIEYKDKAVYKVLGHCVYIAKGSAETLKLNMALILLPVCRNTITWLRNKTNLGVVVPLDDNISFHQVIAVAIAIGVGLHSISHLACDFPRLIHATEEEYEPDATIFWGSSQELLAFCEGSCRVHGNHNGFNAFWYSHHLFVIVYTLLIVHSINLYLTKEWYKKTTWMYLAVPISLYVCERLIRVFRSSVKPVNILRVAVDPGNLVALHMSKPDQGFRYNSGQYIFVNCPAVSPFEWHPFSITSAPGDDYLSVHIKTHGDWTGRLEKVFKKLCHEPLPNSKSRLLRADFQGEILNAARPRVLIDGPYGAPAQEYKKYDIVLLIGLGIGATPMISIVKDIVNNMKAKKTEESALENGTTSKQLKNKSGVTSENNFKTTRAYFYWVTGQQGSFDWFEKVMNEAAEMDKNGVIEMHNYCTSVYEEDDARSALITMLQTLNHAKHGVDVVAGTRVKSHFAPNWREVYEHIDHKHTGSKIGWFGFLFFLLFEALSVALCSLH